MINGSSIALIMPARNEEPCLPGVLSAVPPAIDKVIVVDNGSTDETGAVARKNGARVIQHPVPGYGSACLAGIAALTDNPPDVVAFADADGSDGVENIRALLAPLINGEADMAMAIRVPDSGGALSLQQRFGNRLATCLISLIWGHAYRDLGPMRAITWQGLCSLNMEDRDFGWTMEIQIQTIKAGLRVVEIPLPYHVRAAGRSKISGTVIGVFRAGFKILWVIAREFFRASLKRQILEKGRA